MATHGGARPGAGRQKGSKITRTQELIKKATEGGILPLEVLLKATRFYDQLAEKQLAKVRDQEMNEENEDIFDKIKGLINLSASFAEKAAPYLHPKLSSVEANVTVTGQETALTELE